MIVTDNRLHGYDGDVTSDVKSIASSSPSLLCLREFLGHLNLHINRLIIIGDGFEYF